MMTPQTKHFYDMFGLLVNAAEYIWADPLPVKAYSSPPGQLLSRLGKFIRKNTLDYRDKTQILWRPAFIPLKEVIVGEKYGPVFRYEVSAANGVPDRDKDRTGVANKFDSVFREIIYKMSDRDFKMVVDKMNAKTPVDKIEDDILIQMLKTYSDDSTIERQAIGIKELYDGIKDGAERGQVFFEDTNIGLAFSSMGGANEFMLKVFRGVFPLEDWIVRNRKIPILAQVHMGTSRKGMQFETVLSPERTLFFIEQNLPIMIKSPVYSSVKSELKTKTLRLIDILDKHNDRWLIQFKGISLPQTIMTPDPNIPYRPKHMSVDKVRDSIKALR